MAQDGRLKTGRNCRTASPLFPLARLLDPNLGSEASLGVAVDGDLVEDEFDAHVFQTVKGRSEGLGATAREGD